MKGRRAPSRSEGRMSRRRDAFWLENAALPASPRPCRKFLAMAWGVSGCRYAMVCGGMACLFAMVYGRIGSMFAIFCGKVGCDGYSIFSMIKVFSRTVTRSGQRLLPEVEVSNWWTNLLLQAARCVDLYHAHDTGEQFHSELRGYMGVELLPS